MVIFTRIEENLSRNYLCELFLWFYMKYIGTTGDDEQLINSSTNHRPFSMFFWSGVYPPTTFFLGSYHLKCGMLFTGSNFLSSVNNLK